MNNSDKDNSKNNQSNRQFYEKMAVILVFVFVIFVGVSLFVSPKNKLELNFGTLDLSERSEISENAEIQKDRDNSNLTREKINEQINYTESEIKPNETLSYSQKQYIAAIKRKKIQEILRKQQENTRKNNLRYNSNTKYKRKYKDDYSKIADNQAFQQEIYQEISSSQKYDFSQRIDSNMSKSYENDFYDVLLYTSCRKDEIEYVMKLYSGSKPLTLVFRKEKSSRNVKPEIIYATLPNNRWKDVSESLDRIIGSIFEGLFSEDDTSDSNKTKIGAMITTPCSDKSYLSESFYVSSKSPVLVSKNYAVTNCSSQNGRLPDILELLSIFHHKNLPHGYYMTNSARLYYDPNTGGVTPMNDYVVLDYTTDSFYFTYSSQISSSVYSECVLY